MIKIRKGPKMDLPAAKEAGGIRAGPTQSNQSNPVKPGQTQSNRVKPNQTGSNQSNRVKPVKPGQTSQTESNQSNRVKPNQTKSNRSGRKMGLPVAKKRLAEYGPVKPSQTLPSQTWRFDGSLLM